MVAAHDLFEGRAHFGGTAVLAQSRHDTEDRVAPLAQRHEIVEALEDHVLLAEMRAVAGILKPVPNKSLLGMSNAPICDVVEPLVYPLLEEGEQRAHRSCSSRTRSVASDLGTRERC